VTTSAAVPPDDADPRALERVGQILDEKWTLERILGSGGMGAVYAARHRNGARAAVKVLHPELARRADVRERFLREGYAANRVEHRGAVQVLDDDTVKDGPDEGTAYLVMEILEGESLEERIERGPPLTEVELLRILNDVLAVLEAAHEHGVVHRDLKPANLFLNKDPSGPGVKVLDFGLARLEELRSVTGVGLALGTPSFMAPEQANGRTAEIEARTDIFAVGATAFSILAGRGVHQAEGLLELVARMGTLPAPKLREVAPNVSESVARIVDRALEFKREDRYPSAAAMRADVQEALAALEPPVESMPVSVRVRGDGPVSARSRVDVGAETALDSRRSEPRPARRSFAPYVLAVLVAAGLVLVFVPQARERAGMPNAVSDLFASASPGGGGAAPSASAVPSLAAGAASGGAASGAALGSASAPGSASASGSASALGSASASVPPEDLATAGADVADASADAAFGDAGDDDDDDDDVDASDVAAIIGGHDGGVPTVARPAAAKRPHVSAPRHGRPPRKKRRPRR
jgi:serine/threonine-protein kinase